ncbi:hypothetical protein EZV73_18025 [Acidaminobacter sp. JC074]|uniref:hypothetical protein n=1 Tax=Acidaminobacter sp. JC074 TaxID=2530199 RepID=UPI001F111DAF|nr:hypothetical protein [Acidaminobacter sp. JC074]MCH4889484.1 hypothetical protein [Acidaminobacter sp. JC074]
MKNKVLFVIILCLFVLVSCRKIETSIILLQEDNIQELDDKVIFTKDGNIKRSEYIQYVFDKENFDDKVKNKNSKVEVYFKSKTEENKVPDPMSQSPVGGFVIIIYECDIIKEVNE